MKPFNKKHLKKGKVNYYLVIYLKTVFFSKVFVFIKIFLFFKLLNSYLKL